MAATPTTSQQALGHYVLSRKLGAGAMGEVWLARDKYLDREVAIKLLHAGASDERMVKDFLREAQATAKLNHPNTVTIHQVGKAGGRIYIAMEYVEAGSLADELQARGALPWREATQAIRDAAAGLQAAHERGLVHRDIKPSNLMRSSSGLVKVVDFGLAKSRGGNTEMTMTQPGTILGSPAYMSPEQCRGDAADARSDLYSLTCAYYQLLTRQLPFAAMELTATMFQHCNEPFPDARDRGIALPDGVCRILAKGSRKKPEERYQTAAEMLAELETVLHAPEASQIFSKGKTAAASATASPVAIGAILKGKGIMGKTTWALVILALAWMSYLAVRPAASHRGDDGAPLTLAGSSLQPVPSLSAQYNAEQTIKGIFREEYSQRTPAARTTLALKLLDQGQQNTSDMVMRFVLFREARDLAALAGNTTVAFQAIDETAKGYAIDVVDLKTAAFLTAWSHTTSPDEMHAMVDSGTEVLDQAIAGDHFPAAFRLAPVLESAASKSKDIAILSKVQARNRQLIELRREFDKQKAAFDALRKNPADPEANLAVGSYLCFLKGNWETGLPMLGNGSDAALKALARQELSNPAEPAGELLVADGWWEHGAKQSDVAKESIARHAGTWYQKAFPSLSVAEQARVVARLPKDVAPASTPPIAVGPTMPPAQPNAAPPVPAKTEVGAEPPAHLNAEGHRVVDLMPLIDGHSGREEGHFCQRVGSELTSRDGGTLSIPYEPPQEYDYSVEFTSPREKSGWVSVNQIMSHGGHHFAFVLPLNNPEATPGFGFFNGKPVGKTLTKKRHLCVVQVRNSGLSAYLDGQPILDYPTDYSGVDDRFDGHINDGHLYAGGLGINLQNSVITYHKIEVVEISGKGHLIPPPADDPNLVRAYSAPDVDDESVRLSVAFSADGRHLAKTGQNVTAWNRATGKVVLHQMTYDSRGAGALSRDGRYVFWVGNRGGAHIAEIGGPERDIAFTGFPAFQCADFSPDGSRLATNVPSILDKVGETKLQPEKVGAGTVFYAPDGFHILFWDPHGEISFWDVRTLIKLWTVKGRADFASFSPDGARVAITTDGRIAVMNTATGEIVASINPTAEPNFSPDGHSILLVKDYRHSFIAMDPVSGNDLKRFPIPLPPVSSAEWSADGTRVLAGCKDGVMRLLDYETGKVLQTFGGNVGPVWAVAFSKDGKFVASACNDEKVRVYKVLSP